MRRLGLQTEVLLSLGVVMMAATGVLALVLVGGAEVRLRELLGRSLWAEARANDASLAPGVVEGTRWWRLDVDLGLRGRDRGAGIDAESRALAREALLRRGAIVQLGLPWESIRFAAPLDGGVAVARLPREASIRLRAKPRALALLVLLVDATVFTAFGAVLLRRRLVLPLRRLVAATREIARGERGARARVEGVRETVELALAFDQMSEALRVRTSALERAVEELRDANRDLRVAREGLDRSQRLAAVGRLAAGVAHEVGNPMGALLAFLDLARRNAADPTASAAHLERACREGERVRVILRQLLDFSRPAKPVREPVELLALAREAAELVSAQRRHAGIAFELQQDESVPRAICDRGKTRQVLLNLLVNAADAVAGREGARIGIEVHPDVLDHRRSDAGDARPARGAFDAVSCTVSDNGPGVAEADRERIFDAFFTTKDPGEGTGLGLATATRLAEEQGGSLELLTAPARGGARFALRLPAARRDAPARDRSVRGESARAGGDSATGCGVRNALRGADGAAARAHPEEGERRR